jgi:hypothetical protein
MPDNTDAGWQRLSPSMQQDVGRDSYESWWSSVSSVDLQQTHATDGQRNVDIVLTYRMNDGTAKQENHRITLDRSGGGYLIADDEVLSSRTVS